ncbi:uncharacterized protein EDB91DRAFT_1076905 [Suillus paluster]|uniref:uncharacterized protein n=1 Tax=Suillus paluster TaxID=48578 RepID=UPI001B882302|nr:uncharacterized protein EDB91DRAFT_1076905 [Suillus paluster]KAG1754819.1 hypothetical protein EDB91DRAFT_1076905 [Suillus paluster]
MYGGKERVECAEWSLAGEHQIKTARYVNTSSLPQAASILNTPMITLSKKSRCMLRDTRYPSDRYVLLQWLNGTKDDVPVTQIVQLTVIPVGTFSRAQRDQILRLANQVKFQTTSITNNCRVWLRELPVAMVDEELITQEKFDEIIEVDPLQMRRPEE